MDSRNVLRGQYERLAVLTVRCMERLKAPDADAGALRADIAELGELLRVCAWAAEADGDVNGPVARMREAAAARDGAALAEALGTQVWPLVTSWLRESEAMPGGRA